MSDCAKSPTGVHVSAGESACAWCGEDWMRVLPTPPRGTPDAEARERDARFLDSLASELQDEWLADVSPNADTGIATVDRLRAIAKRLRAASREAGAPTIQPEQLRNDAARIDWLALKGWDNIRALEDIAHAHGSIRDAIDAAMARESTLRAPPTSGEGR